MKLVSSFADLYLIPASLRTCFTCLYSYQVLTDETLWPSLAGSSPPVAKRRQKRQGWGTSGSRRYMDNERGRKGANAGARRVRKCYYALLATRFSLRSRRVKQRGAQHYVHISVTVLTALTFHLFKVEKFSVPF